MRNRICIYAKDIQWIAGKSERWARTLIANIKVAYAKEKHHLVTIREFCEYTDLPYEEVSSMINGKNK